MTMMRPAQICITFTSGVVIIFWICFTVVRLADSW